jgi:antitoxin CptB
MDEAEELRRLRWQCRRGMLELDLLFSRFLDACYSGLSSQEKFDLLRLLNYQDQILQDWFFGEAVPADVRLRELVVRIRSVHC